MSIDIQCRCSFGASTPSYRSYSSRRRIESVSTSHSAVKCHRVGRFPQLFFISHPLFVPFRLTPKTRAELQAQFNDLCAALDISPPSLPALCEVPAERICRAVENMPNGTFRACSQPPHHDLMALQRDGTLERKLREKGVRKIVVGEVQEEWYLYAIAHPVSSPADIKPNVERYFPTSLVEKMLEGEKLEGLGKEELFKRFGEILSDWQVYLPARLMKRDMPSLVARYEIRWTPERLRTEGELRF
jgi:carboxylesterase type B